MAKITSGRINNPSANAVLADTGPVPEITGYLAQVVVSSTVDAKVMLEIRNATNTATVWSFMIAVKASDTKPINFGGVFELEPVERLRLVMDPNLVGSLTGSIQGGLFW